MTNKTSDYKCMFLISPDQYSGLSSSSRSSTPRTVDSGIGGDVNDSHVHNIDVSHGGTLVINDGDQKELEKQNNLQNKRCSNGDERVSSHTHTVTHGDRYPVVVTAQPAGCSHPHECDHSQCAQQGPPPPTPPTSPTKSSAGKSPTSPSRRKSSSKSNNLLRDIVNKRVADLTGVEAKPAKRRRKALSDGDLNRAVIHDIKTASKNGTKQPNSPTLAQRRVARYRAQIAKIRPYKDPDPPTPTASAVKQLRPQEVPLPPSDDSDDDWASPPVAEPTSSARTRPIVRRRQPAGPSSPSSTARTRPILLARRPPHKFKLKKRDQSKLQSGYLDHFSYEPQNKRANHKNAPVRRVGAIARKKRGPVLSEEDKRLEKMSFPSKRTIYPLSFFNDDESIPDAE